MIHLSCIQCSNTTAKTWGVIQNNSSQLTNHSHSIHLMGQGEAVKRLWRWGFLHCCMELFLLGPTGRSHMLLTSASCFWGHHVSFSLALTPLTELPRRFDWTRQSSPRLLSAPTPYRYFLWTKRWSEVKNLLTEKSFKVLVWIIPDEE